MEAATMPRERSVPVAAGKVRRTLTLPEELLDELDAWRAAQRPIPTESQAVAELLRQALAGWREQADREDRKAERKR
jgi:metal-responsive CopG/Arc/MetJ family transcriptional regulator